MDEQGRTTPQMSASEWQLRRLVLRRRPRTIPAGESTSSTTPYLDLLWGGPE